MDNFYANKKVLVTGHTGFKGSWISTWLLMLGSKVYGYSKGIPTEPSMFRLTGLDSYIESHYGDILDFDSLKNAVDKIQPDIIFHIAAQPIMSLAVEKPLETFQTNIIGTSNVLEVLRQLENKCSLVSITSDKSYLNKEWVWGYKETDELGGKDPYSASKAGAEMVLNSYFNTYFKKSDTKRMAVVRSGNIIGGGDWAYKRIVPDCIRAWQNEEAVVLRSPDAIRPWQHVVEPLYGYLLLAQQLHNDITLNGEAFNFGPSPLEFKSVGFLVGTLSELMNERSMKTAVVIKKDSTLEEAQILKLNTEKALSFLGWKPTLGIEETLEYTAEWYYNCVWKKSDKLLSLTQNQINNFSQKIKQSNLKMLQL
jgi:CDP-glucose 4,6-dehydratase